MKLKKSVKNALVTGIVAIGLSISSYMAINSTIVKQQDVTMKEVLVQQGDTIWTLVSKENPNYKGDLRNLTDFVKGDGNIKPGQIIEVPVYKN